MHRRRIAHDLSMKTLRRVRLELDDRPAARLGVSRKIGAAASGAQMSYHPLPMPPLNQIIAGDSIAYLNKQPPEWVDLVFADPPFNIGYLYDNYDDRKNVDEYLDFSRKWMAAVYRALKPTGSFYLAIGDEFASDLCVIARRELGFHMRNWIIWHYTFGQQTRKMFAKSHTHILYFSKQKPVAGLSNLTFNADAVRVASARQTIYGDSRANAKGKLPDDTWFLRPQEAGYTEPGYRAFASAWSSLQSRDRKGAPHTTALKNGHKSYGTKGLRASDVDPAGAEAATVDPGAEHRARPVAGHGQARQNAGPYESEQHNSGERGAGEGGAGGGGAGEGEAGERDTGPGDFFAGDCDTWNISRVCGTFKEREGWHGCQMPIGVLDRIIKASSNPGDIVLDPFNGSGTTAVSAALLGRGYVGIDQSKEYVAFAQKRLNHALKIASQAKDGSELAATLDAAATGTQDDQGSLAVADATAGPAGGTTGKALAEGPGRSGKRSASAGAPDRSGEKVARSEVRRRASDAKLIPVPPHSHAALHDATRESKVQTLTDAFGRPRVKRGPRRSPPSAKP